MRIYLKDLEQRGISALIKQKAGPKGSQLIIEGSRHWSPEMMAAMDHVDEVFDLTDADSSRVRDVIAARRILSALDQLSK